jgi:hypothetical protein
MDNANVDLRKLQLLSDRLTQTIEALNQVRLSVQGVPTPGAGAYPGVQGVSPYGYPYPNVQSAYPYAAGQIGGFGHTSGISPQAFGYQQHPLQAALLAQHNAQLANAWGASPFGVGGFAHTSPGYDDPYSRYTNAAARIGQTLPFAPWGYSPFASGFSPFAQGMY